MSVDMDSARQQVQAAIDRSIYRNEIVHLPWTPEVASYLTYLADDDARTVPTHEFWGEQDGSPWRVHLDILPAVRALRDDAGAAGDEALHTACLEVLESDDARAWGIVLRALDDAAAMVEA